MVRLLDLSLAAAVGLLTSSTLQGCGGHKPSPSPSPSPSPPPSPAPSPSPSPSPPPTPPTPPPPAPGWTLPPIEVRGSHLYNSETGEQFRAKGLGFPNVGEDVDEWVRVLQRLKKLSSTLNVVRIYELPTCAFSSDCFKKFMHEADSLGIYVLVPGTGTTWGWLPGQADACKPQTPEGCYKAGQVLGFGQNIIQRFNYPNTLAIVMGNEFDMQMLTYIPLLKAYARDLKKHMLMCNTSDSSPTMGKMRSIPLMYACSDNKGDEGVFPKADYLFCDSEAASVDVFGLNVERWCEDVGGKTAYDAINKFVEGRSFPGAFFFSEMGCSKTNTKGGTRTWTQVRNFFNLFPGVDGFAAYVYNGNKDFDMFDGPYANSTENDDGKVFFSQMKAIGDEPQAQPASVRRPACPATILGESIADYKNIQAYDTGPHGEPTSCPEPYSKTVESEFEEMVVF